MAAVKETGDETPGAKGDSVLLAEEGAIVQYRGTETLNSWSVDYASIPFASCNMGHCASRSDTAGWLSVGSTGWRRLRAGCQPRR